jgi:hypothetical protein
MPINAGAIRLGHCYATAGGDLRKVIEVRGDIITYFVRGKLAFPTWDKAKWRSVSRGAFTYEVTREVPCDWQPEEAGFSGCRPHSGIARAVSERAE